MSGKRQHFIPQFLLRGFSSRESKEVFTWLYRKSNVPFETNIKNVGVEGKFYTTEQDFSLDDAITNLEPHYAELIGKLREAPSGSISCGKFPEFISHIESRSRYIRHIFQKPAYYFVDKLAGFLEDENKCMEFFCRKIEKNPEIIRKEVVEFVKNSHLPDTAVDLVTQLLLHNLRTLLKESPVPFSLFAKMARENLVKNILGAVKNGHISALKVTTSPEFKQKKYEQFEFSVYEVSGNNLILGDSMLLFYVRSQKRFMPFWDQDNLVNAVVLPISSKKLLIGCERDFSVDVSDINSAVAACSLEFFVGNRLAQNLKELQSMISTAPVPFSEKNIDEILREKFDE